MRQLVGETPGTFAGRTVWVISSVKRTSPRSPTCPQTESNGVLESWSAELHDSTTPLLHHRNKSKKEGHHGYQLRKAVQPPDNSGVAANPGLDPGCQLGRRLLLAGR